MFMDLVISKPLHSAMHQTTQIIFYTEDKIKKVRKTTRRGLDIVKEPLKPVFDLLIKGIEFVFDKAEPVRQIIEPKQLKIAKKKSHEELVNYDYNQYTITHPKIIRKMDRKRNKHK